MNKNISAWAAKHRVREGIHGEAIVIAYEEAFAAGVAHAQELSRRGLKTKSEIIAGPGKRDPWIEIGSGRGPMARNFQDHQPEA